MKVRRLKKKSQKMIERLTSALFFANKASTALCCFKIELHGFKYSDSQRTKMHEASNLFHKAQSIVKEVYAEMIGQQIVSEL
jgi:hypothetical protein